MAALLSNLSVMEIVAAQNSSGIFGRSIVKIATEKKIAIFDRKNQKKKKKQPTYLCGRGHALCQVLMRSNCQLMTLMRRTNGHMLLVLYLNTGMHIYDIGENATHF